MPKPVTDGIWRVDLGNVNAYIVETAEGPVTVDAGMPKHAGRLQDAIRTVGLEPASLARVLVTHTDLDHVGGLAELVEGTDARINVSSVAAGLLMGERKPPWLSTKGLFQRLTGPWVTSPPVDRLDIVSDGDRVDGVLAFETPGHALGHVAYLHEASGTCFIGDLVRTEGPRPAFPPRLINYDGDQLAASLSRLLERAPGIEIVCAGHGEPVGEGAREQLAALLG